MWEKQKQIKKNDELNDAIREFNNRSNVYDKDGYDEKCDMWSVGVIAFTILTGEHPFRLDISQE